MKNRTLFYKKTATNGDRPILHDPIRSRVVLLRSIFVVILLAIFTTELAVNDLLSTTLPNLNLLQASLADAFLLSIFAGAFCWLAILRPLKKIYAPTGMSLAPELLLPKVLVSIFLAEFLVMIAVTLLLPPLDQGVINLIDALLTTMLLMPLLWGIVIRPLSASQQTILIEYLMTPLKLYVLLILTVFLSDLLETMVTPLFFTFGRRFTIHLGDAFMTSLFVAPFLWFLIVRPLRRTADIEKAYSVLIRDKVRDAIVTIDADGVIEAFNAAAETIFGYAASEVVGKSFATLLSEDRQLETLLCGSAEDSPENNFVRIQDVTAVRKDGSSLDMAVSISRILLGGKQQYLAILRDLTDRKKIETTLRESSTRFRELFEQTEDAIIFLKPGTCSIIDANATAERLFGYCRSELSAGGLELISRPADLEWLNMVISSINTTKNLQLPNIIVLGRDGTEINVSLHGKLINIMGVGIVYCTLRDISERINMEAEARDIQAKLIHANKMTSLGLLVSGVAHEINNPNTYIMANSELLCRIWTDAAKILREYYRENGDFQLGGLSYAVVEETSPQLFAGIVEGTKRIDGIIRDLKDYAREERGFSASSVDINRVATSAVTIVHHHLLKYTENFRLELTDNIPPVRGSYQQLEQVLINLLMNACQALPARDHGIWLNTGFDTDAGQVTITVKDEGQGMSSAVSQRVLEPFFTTRLDSGGTGLGLSISSTIIKEHNGMLEFESEPGRGTVFTIKLPTAI